MPFAEERRADQAINPKTAVIPEHQKKLNSDVDSRSMGGVNNPFKANNAVQALNPQTARERDALRQRADDAVHYSTMKYSLRVEGKPGGERIAHLSITTNKGTYKEDIKIPKGYDLKLVTVPAHKSEYNGKPVQVMEHSMLALIRQKGNFESRLGDTAVVSDRVYIDLTQHNPRFKTDSGETTRYTMFNYSLLSKGGAEFRSGAESVGEVMRGFIR